VHGLSSEFLADKPLFAHVVEEFLEFMRCAAGDSQRVVRHRLLNAELERIKRQPIARDRLVDTLLLARRKHPGVSNRLDDLCSRYAIDNSRRTKHGALLDAELLAEVYIDLIGARQSQLTWRPRPAMRARRVRRNAAAATPDTAGATGQRSRSRAHQAFVATLGDKPIWKIFWALFSSALPGRPVRQPAFQVLAVRPTKSTGSSISGGKPPSRTEVAMISRANGNSSRGHSIMISGCRFSLARSNAEDAGIGRSKLNITLPTFSACLRRKRHFVLVFGDIVALTLIWI